MSGRQIVTRDRLADQIGREFGVSGRTVQRNAADVALFEQYPELKLCERIWAGNLTFREAKREIREHLGIKRDERAELEKKVTALRRQLATAEARLNALIGGAA